MVEQIFPATCGGLMLQQGNIARRKKGLLSASPKRQSATSGGNTAWGELEPGKHDGKMFSLSV